MTNRASSESETIRLTITWYKDCDFALRAFLGGRGMKKSDLSKFIEEAVRWQIFRLTVRDVRTAFSDVRPSEIQTMIDKAVEEVRAEHDGAKRS
jgi:hypothetical protein